MMLYTSSMTKDLEYSSANFPTVIVNDGSVETIEQAERWIGGNLQDLKRELDSSGAVLFRDFPIADVEGFDRFFSAFGYANFTYRESLSNAVRIDHTERVFTANEAPKDVEIFIHNEMAQTPIYPNVISLFCQTAAEKGGATTICRSDEIYNQLLASHPDLTEKLETLGVKYTSRMPSEDMAESGQGRSWKGTLSVDTRDQAEGKLQELGYSWQWNDDGSLSAQTSTLPAVQTYSTGRKVFFNQLIAAYMGWEGVRDNPSVALCFGDGSDIPASFLDAAVRIAESISHDLAWQDGDVAIVNNMLSMHGRRPYSGDRKRSVFVTLGLNRDRANLRQNEV